ncbi:hypothetical protein QTP88_027748 [Uroleucon formosanum]
MNILNSILMMISFRIYVNKPIFILYRSQENALVYTSVEIKQFIGVQMYMGIVKMPSYRMFWNNHTHFSTVSDVMARNRFDNIRPFLNAIRDNMKKVHVNECIAVDEIIIPFKGCLIMKQYNKNKPHKWGIKMFSLASSNRLVDDFKIYVGKGTLPPSYHGLGLIGDVVMRLIKCVPKNENYKVSMDNWFNSYNLHCRLKFVGVQSIRTERSNCVATCVLENYKPVSIGQYNSYMDGIDLHDILVELYRVNIRVRQYYLRIVYHLLDMDVLEISHALLQYGKILTLKRGRPLSNTPSNKKRRTFTPRSTNNVSYDETGHWQIRVIEKQR